MDNAKYPGLIRWGIIGCGDVTEIKSGPAYQKVDGFQIKAVMRRDIAKAKDYAKRHGVEKYYDDADDLINDTDIDAVYIATPPDSHMVYALKVAKAGKPCCIEKPMTPSYKDSLVIYEAFKKKNIPLFVAYYRRSMPRFAQVKNHLENNEIGEVRHISWNLIKAPSTIDLSGQYNWRTDKKVAPGGYFDDLASHGLDLFTYLLGNIKEVSGIAVNQQKLYSAKDAFAAHWLHDTGVTGTGSWNFGSDESMDRVEIFGSKGKLEFSIFEDNPIVLSKPHKREEIYIKNHRNIQLHHVENMKRELMDGDYVHPSGGKSALHTSWVMSKILDQ
jgi:predicted dehydrogenase